MIFHVILWLPMSVQDHSCFLGWGAEDCQEGPENPENQRQDNHKVEHHLKRMETAVLFEVKSSFDGGDEKV
jgi:hypothetical protein